MGTTEHLADEPLKVGVKYTVHQNINQGVQVKNRKVEPLPNTVRVVKVEILPLAGKMLVALPEVKVHERSEGQSVAQQNEGYCFEKHNNFGGL